MNLKKSGISETVSEISGSHFGKTVQSFLTCSNCLSPGHLACFCSNQSRCKICFNYGHLSRWCLTRARPKIFWKPKHLENSPKTRARPNLVWKPKKLTDVSRDTNALILGEHTVPPTSLPNQENTETYQSTVQPCSPLADHQSPASSTMAKFDVNPIP